MVFIVEIKSVYIVFSEAKVQVYSSVEFTNHAKYQPKLGHQITFYFIPPKAYWNGII